MSVKAVRWALYEAPVLLTEKGKPDTTARHVLVAMADPAHDDGTNAFSSPLRIHWVTGLDERTVSRAIARLERAGLIRQEGVRPSGTKCWALALDLQRTDSWDECKAAAEKVRRVESERRHGRRVRAAMSGTQNPGQDTDVRDAESRRPALSVPASGTQNPDVRDAVPPEPSVEPSVEPSGDLGGTLPPDPLRRDAPQAGHLNDQANSPREGGPSQLLPVGDPPHAHASIHACPECGAYLDRDGSCFRRQDHVRTA